MTAIALDTIDLFENAASTPERLASVRKLGPHAKAFVRLWRAVSDAVHATGYLMRTDLMRSAAENTQPARIWLDGFLNFSPLEREFVQSLANVCDLTLTLTDSPATDEIRKFAMLVGAEDRLLTGPPRRPETTLIEAPHARTRSG